MFVQSKTDEDRHVMPHEILFRRDDRKHSTRMQAMSSLNGIEETAELRDALREISALFSQTPFRANLDRADLDTMLGDWKDASESQDDAERRTARLANLQLTQLFRYVGVAITGCQSGAAGALQRQGFSATRGGLMTIVNTGENTIYPGTQIRMEFDWGDLLRAKSDKHRLTHIDGIPKNKLIPRLVADDDFPQTIDEAGPLLFNLQWAGSFGPDPLLLRRRDFARS